MERDVFLFEATDLNSCISSLEMIRILKHLTLVVAFDFLRSLLTRWTRDRVDFELEKVENRQNIHQNVHEKWESPWNVDLQLKDLIVIIQKLEEIKFIHFFGGG